MDFTYLLLPQFAAMGLSVALFAPVVLYIIARWRNRETPDPQLGLKFALHYFGFLAFQLALAGATLLIYTMIRPGESKGETYRMAFGFLLPAAIVLIASLVLLSRTNDAQHTGVRKLFLGFNLLLTGMLGFAALVLGFQALFAKGSTGGMGHLGGAAILVYCSAWLVIGWRYYQLVVGSTHVWGSGDPPDIVAPPMSPPQGGQVPPGGSATGLPALGGGSFPPLEKK